ncbi:hypothetical protein [Micromonospora coxensis]|uniref:Uncharacterized protein n=1 Tax=Micromonospora coxensis TaxID=356852 RepID=A0A1C5IA28_9ACTN|nr:hypothetical protein [Micromonospora coxensis]SCG55288.1 hypothetical protein GA0070614_2485 [Micromonospora coxensis]
MAFRTWGRLLLTALGVSVLAGAGQLGIAYGFGIVRLTGAFTDGAVDRWPAQLAWVGWFAVSAAVVGAVVTGRLARRDGLPEQTSVQLAVSGAAALGATVVAPLCMQPARAAELSTVDPVFAVGICAVAGAVVGAAAASAVLLKPPLGWNVAMLAGAVWLIALISVAPGLLSADPLRTVRLGVLEPSWLDADAAQRLAMLLLPTVALLAGAATGALARWQGHVPLIGGAAGAAGPVLLAFAYLTAGPGDSADRYQLAPYYGAVIAVAAGALGSTAATLVRWPLVPTRTEDGAIAPTDILRPLPTEPATAGATAATTVDLAGAAGAARTAVSGRPDGGTPAHWDWPVTPGTPAPAGTPEPAPAADGRRTGPSPVDPAPAWPAAPSAAPAEASTGTGTRRPSDDRTSAPAPAATDGDLREPQVARGDTQGAPGGDPREPRVVLGDAPDAPVGGPRAARVVLGDAPAAVRASGPVTPPGDAEPVASATVRPDEVGPDPLEPTGPVAAADVAGSGRAPDAPVPSAAAAGSDSGSAEPVGGGPVVAPRPRPKRPRKARAAEADPAGAGRPATDPTPVPPPSGTTPDRPAAPAPADSTPLLATDRPTPAASTGSAPAGSTGSTATTPFAATPAGSTPGGSTPRGSTAGTPSGSTAGTPAGSTTEDPARVTTDPAVTGDATTRTAGAGGPGVDGERPGTGAAGVPPTEPAPRPRHRLPDLASAGDWEAFGVRSSPAGGALPFPAPPRDAEAPKPVAFRWHAEEADTTATGDGDTGAPAGSPTDAEPSVPVRPRRGLFRRGKGKGGAPAPEAAQEEPLAAQDEEFVDWVAGLSRPLADNEPERESGRRSLRSSGRHHRD